jgi:hypothetical protein
MTSVHTGQESEQKPPPVQTGIRPRDASAHEAISYFDLK